MKKLLLITVLLASANVFSAETSSLQLATKLITQLNIDAQSEVMAKNMRDMQAKQIAQLGLPSEAMPAVNEYLDKQLTLLFSMFKSDEMRKKYAEAYMSVYTHDELRDIVAFYDSPAGKKMLEKAPELNTSIIKVAEKYVLKIQPEALKLQKELKQNLSKYQ